METVFGVLLHRDMWRREGDGVWPLRNVSATRERVDTQRLRAGSPQLYAQDGLAVRPHPVNWGCAH